MPEPASPLEFDLIAAIRRRADTHEGVCLGIGDDAALVRVAAGQVLVATVDTLNEGVHFRPGVHASDLGHKSLAVNLSDLAAMGAEAKYVLLSLSHPEPTAEWLDGFLDGFLTLALEYRVSLIGGDLTRGPLSVTVTALGEVTETQALARSGAQPGDRIVVSGVPGEAALALRLREQGETIGADLNEALNRPRPRLGLGRRLARHASACIDCSDGLAQDLGHILGASGMGATVELGALPVSRALEGLAEEQRWSLQLGGGDDYELCFTLPAKHDDRLAEWSRELGLLLTVIGRVEETPGLRFERPDGSGFQLQRTGYRHFEHGD